MKRQRGRPREFDLAETILVAQAVFWKHGLEATSLNQIAQETGLHKPSLYAAFGDKLALYIAALDAYMELAATLIAKSLSATELRVALAAFFKADLDFFMAEGGRGCFLLSTAVPVAGMHPEVAKRVKKGNAGVEIAFRQRLETAQRVGEMPRGRSIEPFVQMLTSTHMALGLRARSGATRKELQKTADSAINLVCGNGQVS